MAIRCKVVMLTTKKRAGLAIFNRYNNELHKFGQHENSYADEVQFKHLYVTSKEKIKEDDWYLKWSGGKWLLFQATYEAFIYMNGIWNGNEVEYRKIIATTDPLLNLPKIKQSFIDKYITEYNKGDVIEDVLVELDED